MKTQRTRAGFTLIELLVVITIIAILAGIAIPATQQVMKIAHQGKGVSNCRQVILALKQFAGKNQTQYPDSVLNPLTGTRAATANEAFHMLFQQHVTTDERIFGCPAGFNPDTAIGTSPNYATALTADENHWAMTAGLTDTSAGNLPLVFENPAVAEWSPKWNAGVAGQIKPGRTWTGGQIIIGRVDGGAEVLDLDGIAGMVGPRKMVGGMDLFTQATEGQTMGILLPLLTAANPSGPSLPSQPTVPGGLGQLPDIIAPPHPAPPQN